MSSAALTCKNLISRAFAPNVSIAVSDDVTEVCKEMDVDGLLDLIMPFGDCINGRITVRDSQNISKSYDDFAVRFRYSLEKQEDNNLVLFDNETLEKLLQSELEQNTARNDETNDNMYINFITRILSSFPVAPFETFSHPVCGVIAVSSRNEQPIENLATLYKKSHENIPGYIDKDYLRYYVLIHDENGDDLDKSIALFEKMKRNFGVHCHMIRINRKEKDSELEPSKWLNTRSKNIPINKDDIFAIQQFTRELVASSIVPFMERCIATWNDQIASSRRGLTGRFFSASKKYFSSSPALLTGNFQTNNSNNGTSTSASSGNSRGNYNPHESSYQYQGPEAQLRKLADFAFMLRDYKFAQTTYDLLKRDFHNDKAWAYLASAQEMSAVSWLMTTNHTSNQTGKSKNDTLDSLLDSATYSYISRCSLPCYALRCILLSSELLMTQLSSQSPQFVSEGATKWILKALNERLVGRLGYALLTQRLGDVFLVHNEITSRNKDVKISSSSSLISTLSNNTIKKNSTRSRKAAFWHLLAAREWNEASQTEQSAYCLNKADTLAYNELEWTKSATGLFGRLIRLVGGVDNSPNLSNGSGDGGNSNGNGDLNSASNNSE